MFSSRLLGVVLDRFIRTSPRVRSLNFRFADNCKLEMFASAAVVRHALIMPAGVVSPSSALGPSTSRITTARSRNACAPLP